MTDVNPRDGNVFPVPDVIAYADGEEKFYQAYPDGSLSSEITTVYTREQKGPWDGAHCETTRRYSLSGEYQGATVEDYKRDGSGLCTHFDAKDQPTSQHSFTWEIVEYG